MCSVQEMAVDMLRECSIEQIEKKMPVIGIETAIINLKQFF